MDKIKVVVVTHPDDEISCVLGRGGCIRGMEHECEILWEEGANGDSVTFRVAYMTQKQLDDMEEFNGW